MELVAFSPKDLDSFSTKDLETELRRRQLQEEEARNKAEKEEVWQMYLKRPAFPVVGRAYHTNNLHSALITHCLAMVIVAGNAQQEYKVSLQVAPAVHTYLNNSLSEDEKHEFRRALQELVNDYVYLWTREPHIIVTLVCLSSPLFSDKPTYSEWHKAAIERLVELGKSNLEASSAYFKRHHSFHGETELIEESIAQLEAGDH